VWNFCHIPFNASGRCAEYGVYLREYLYRETSRKTFDMKKKKDDKVPGRKAAPGYPPYPAEEDIYRRGEELPGDAPDDPGEGRDSPRPGPDDPNEKDDLDPRMGDDLDVPGSELDDPEESIGEEDEENNYYSLEDQEDDIPPEE
jgi:hypothetical protein